MPQMFEEQLNITYITTVRHRKTSIFHMLTFEKTQPKLLDKLDQTYSNLTG